MPTRVVAALSLAVLAVACSPPLDTASLEEQVAAQLGGQFGGEWAVECPDRVEPRAGHSFRCMAASDDDRLELRITQEDAEGSLVWRIVE